MNAKARRAAAISAALDLINRVKARDGIMTDAERAELVQAKAARAAEEHEADAAQAQAAAKRKKK